MAFEIGTATGHNNLFDLFRTFALANGWTQLEWSGAVTNRLLWLRASGLSGTEQIFVGLRSYESVPSDYYNLSVFGSVGWVSGNTYLTQPGFSGAYGVPMWNQSIPYWFVINGQRAIVVAKIENVFTTLYIGKLLPLGATPSQYPYPLIIGGCLTSEATTRYSDLGYSSWHVSIGAANLKLRLVNGTWSTVELWPQNNTLITMRNTNANSGTAAGDYVLYAMQVGDATNLYGFFDGIFFISGFNNAIENTVAIGGVNYLVVPNIWRTGIKDYMDVRLS